MQSPRVVLVVDDDETLRFLAKKQLKRLGFDCDVAVDGAEAVKKTESRSYDLIFMDVQMPVMDGLEATQAIRQKESDEKRVGYTPIVAMTANSERQRCYDAGMNDYVFKPVNLSQLEKMLQRWIS